MPTPNDDLILCRASVELPLSIDSGEIMYLPGGEHEISPFGGGIGKPINIKIDAKAAQELERERAAILSKRSPYFDFNHDDREASFWPTEFVWRDGEKPGVYAKGEWSARGKEAVQGRAYRYFSPVFFVDNKHATPAKVVCRESAAPNMGGLTNDPAFHNILPLWAKSGAGQAQAESTSAGAPSDSASTKENISMTPEEIAALQAKQTELETQVEQLKAKLESKKNTEDASDEVVAAAEAELRATVAELKATQANTRIAEQQALIDKRTKSDADAAIKAAIMRGAIQPKDIAFQRKLTDLAIKDPSYIKDVIEKLPGHEALETRRITRGSGDYQFPISVAKEDPIMVYGELARIVSRQAHGPRDDRGRAARDFAALYASEFNGPNKNRLLSFPIVELETAIQATDVTDGSLGTLAGVLVTQRVLELLKFTFPALTAFTTDFSDQNVTFNQTLITRIVSIPNVTDYNTTTGWAASTAATTDVPVTLDKHKGVQIEFNEQILASTMRRLFDEFAPASAYALAKALVDALYANITDANFTHNRVIALTSFTRATISSIGTDLDLLGVPSGAGMRTLLLYPTYYEKVVNDTTIVSLGTQQMSTLITQPSDGVRLKIPVDDFDVIKAPNLPTNNGNVVGFAGSKSSLLIVTRVPNDYTTVLPGANNGNVQIVTDPDVGISVMLVQYVNHTLGRAAQRIALMFGTAAGQGNAGELIKAATGSGSSQTS